MVGVKNHASCSKVATVEVAVNGGSTKHVFLCNRYLCKSLPLFFSPSFTMCKPVFIMNKIDLDLDDCHFKA